MTPEMMLDAVTYNQLSVSDARKQLLKSEHQKTIRRYLSRGSVTTEPLSSSELTQLVALVNLLQVIYSSDTESPVSDSDYETLHELMIDSGVPRITSDGGVSKSMTETHRYTSLRGTLDKVHYLLQDEKKTNPSRKRLDDWISSMENRYEKLTGKRINLNDVMVTVQPKFDGVSVIAEIDHDGKIKWLTRGDTKVNLAVDVTPIMRRFNDVFSEYRGCGIKFEVMVTEQNRERINTYYADKPYRASRQIVSATLLSKTLDIKADYLYPVPLRMMTDGDEYESIFPGLMKHFPVLECRLSERKKIGEYASTVHTVGGDNSTLRTDGAVITIMDPDIRRVLGRDNDTNHFEVAYKFTEETAYSEVVDIDFSVSEFGYVTPVLIVRPVILRGNTITRISLSNRERYDELKLAIGDTVKVLYDIIPYATLDGNCRRSGRNRIPFVRNCPVCGSELELDRIQVQCTSPTCPSRVIGRIVNWCSGNRIQSLGFKSIETLCHGGLLDKGIRSLYKLKKQITAMEDLPGFGRLKAKHIVSEIESKRILPDYQVLGNIGIEGLSSGTFQLIFQVIPYGTFHGLIASNKLKELRDLLVTVPGTGDIKSSAVISYFSVDRNRKDFTKLTDELSVQSTYTDGKTGKEITKGITFSGFRPTDDETNTLEKMGYTVLSAVTGKTTVLVIPYDGYDSSSVRKATTRGITVLTIPQFNDSVGTEVIPVRS